jgi:hypothetical protein
LNREIASRRDIYPGFTAWVVGTNHHDVVFFVKITSKPTRAQKPAEISQQMSLLFVVLCEMAELG